MGFVLVAKMFSISDDIGGARQSFGREDDGAGFVPGPASDTDICNPRLTSALGVQHRSRDRKLRARRAPCLQRPPKQNKHRRSDGHALREPGIPGPV